MILQHRSMRTIVIFGIFLLFCTLAGCNAIEAAKAGTAAPGQGGSPIDGAPTPTAQTPSNRALELSKPSPSSLPDNTAPAAPSTVVTPAVQPAVSPLPILSPQPGEAATASPVPSPAETQAAPQPSASPAPVTPTQPKTSVTEEKKEEIVYPITSFKHKTAIWLTFDDGGNKKAVQKALDILEQNDIQCTFFVIGKYLKTNKDLWKKAVEQGHLICNHTQNHKWLSDLSTDGVKQEILEWEASATEVLGEDYVKRMKEEFPYLRMPGGAAANSKRVLRIISDLGYTPIGWNVETYYAVLRHYDLNKDPLDDITRSVASHVTKKATGGSIILLHFNPYDTGRLDEIITGIQDKGLSFELSPLSNP